MTTSARGERTLRRARALSVVTAFLLALGWIVLGSPSAAADGPTTFDNTTSIAIPATGSANQTGPASPYPSTISVSGMSGAVSKVTVTFNGLTHGSLGDVDAMVVAPNGANVVVLSDVGNPNQLVTASNINMTFDDNAAGPVPAQVVVPSGSYRPTNTNPGGATDSFPASAPTPSNDVTLADAFTGLSSANGTWSLYIVDDAEGDVGTMAGGWSIAITTEVSALSTTTTVSSSDTTTTTGNPVTFTATVKAGATAVTAGSVQFSSDGTNLGTPVPLNASGVATLTTSSLAEGSHLIRANYTGATGFLTSNGTVSQRVDNATVVTGTTYCNTGPITPPEKGIATPYPSNIFVTGLSGQVTNVTATLKGLSHQAPIDFDILLSGPTPAKNVVLLSDAGGQNPVSNLTVDFDDAAASAVPTPLVSGTFKPTNLTSDTADSWPVPAPAVSGATTLSTFNGVSGNGTWSLWVVDDATGDTGSISGGWCLTITSQLPTTTALTSSPNPSTFGQSVTLSATVSSAGNPVSQGTVQFTDGGTAIGDPVPVGNDGKASIPTTTLSVGTHTIAADYTGVGNLADSSGTTSQVVNKATTSTVLTSAPNPSAVDESVTFTATVTSGGDPITSGSVLFTDDGTNLAPAVPVAADGTATLTTSDLTAGTHSIVATYDGTATLAGSHSSDLDQVVNKFDTATSLTSSKTPSEFGDLVTFTASVTSNGAPVTTGSVEFTEGATSLGTAPVAADGTASLNTASLAIGSHQIRASFSGTAALGTSSDVVTQVVEKIATTVVLTADPTSTTFGEPVTFAATVTTAAGPVTEGTVTFQFFGIPAVERPLDAGGTATYSTATLPAGTEIVTATYSGTDLYATGFANQSFTVDQLETTTTLTSDPERESTAGEDVTFTATVASAGSPVADGSVLFSIDGENPRTVDLQADGTAAFTTSDLAVGTHTIRAQYRGTNTYRLSFDEITYAVNPLAEAGGPYEVAEGGALTLDGSGSTTADRYEWDLNGDDDFTDATGADPTLTWAQLDALGIDDGPADRTVRVRVTAGGGLTSTAAAALRVTNTAPISVITGGLAATVGVPFTIKVGADDPSSADMAADFTYTIDWGDGSPVETLTGPADPPATHTYATVGDFAASFTATDKDGGKGDPTSVTVAVTPAQESPTPTPTPTSTTTATATATSTVRSEPTSTPGGGAGDSLASTGSDVGIGTIVLGGGLLLGGGALLLAARRRRASRGTHE